MSVVDRPIERVRHTLRFRQAEVANVSRITPLMVRVTLTSPEFHDFTSLAHDDHVRLFFPAPGATTVLMPEAGPNGPTFPPGAVRPPSRDYTPRAFDSARRELTIDFVLHGDGVAASWAAGAKPGDVIGVGGPRGSFIVRGDFDWRLFVGDETALPAIGRALEELPLDVRAIAIIEVANGNERQVLESPARLDLHWIKRGDAPPGETNRLLEALESLTLPSGEGYAFIAGESGQTKALRAHLTDRRGLPLARVRASGYWRRGVADFHDGHTH